MKVGLVLEGGAMRGMYTAGILDAFLDNDIDVDALVGVSAGALFGVNYVSKQRGRAIRYNKRFNSDKNYMGLRPLFREGNIVSTEYAYHKVPKELDKFDDEAYKKSNISFYAVVTNMENGKAEYIKVKSVFEQMDTLRASGSMPFVSRPVTIGDNQYLDGAVADSIPFEFMRKLGCDKVIVVLTRNLGYIKAPLPKVLIRLWYGKKTAFSKRLAKRHLVYNRSIEKLQELEAKGEVFVFRPSRPMKIGKIEKNPKRLQKVYELGLLDGREQMNKLKEYLK